MRRSLPLIAAAAIVAASIATIAPAESAAKPVLLPLVATSPAQHGGAVELVQGGRWDNNGWGHGDRHNAFRDDRWRHHRRHRRHHSRHFRPHPFFYGFPFAFVQPYHRHRGYHNCFRTWDGQLLCR